jgi:uncharacterized protein (DUF2384 family)
MTFLASQVTERQLAEPPFSDAVAVKALARVLKAWGVKGPEAAKLAGVSDRTWSRMKSEGWTGSLSQDQRFRASGLVGLYKGLHLYFSDALADQWPRMPNRGPLFQGQSPVDFMVEGGLPAILAAREYVDAVRGGM